MKIEKQLKLYKKSITPERVKLFEFMQGIHLFSAVDTEKAFPELSRASIFRTLKLYVEIGVLRRIQLWDKAETYEVNDVTHHHEHMKCTNCGKVTSFESNFLCKLLLQVSKNKEFQMQEHSINILWICKECTGEEQS